jgi:hypothetical protein
MSLEEIKRDRAEADQRDKTKAAIKAKIRRFLGTEAAPQEVFMVCPIDGHKAGKETLRMSRSLLEVGLRLIRKNRKTAK